MTCDKICASKAVSTNFLANSLLGKETSSDNWLSSSKNPGEDIFGGSWWRVMSQPGHSSNFALSSWMKVRSEEWPWNSISSCSILWYAVPHLSSFEEVALLSDLETLVSPKLPLCVVMGTVTLGVETAEDVAGANGLNDSNSFKLFSRNANRLEEAMCFFCLLVGFE